MNTRHIIVVLLSFVLTGYSQIQYSANPDGLTSTLTGWVSPPADIAIPEIVDNLVVTAIGADAFAFESVITQVLIPDTVTNIGNSAFYSCTSLTNVTGGRRVVTIGSSAFYGCSSLRFLPNITTRLEEIGASAFRGCTSLDVRFLAITRALKIIQSQAFQDSFQTDYSSDYGFSPFLLLATPDTLHSVGDFAFKDASGITSLIVGQSVTGITVNSFADMVGLTNVTIDTPVPISFPGSSSLSHVEFGSKITSIGDSAFIGSSIETVDLRSSSITSILNHAFSGCVNLKDFKASNTLRHIGVSSFYNCVSLTNATLYSGIAYLDDYAFGECTNLYSVVLPASLTNVASTAFLGADNLSHLTLKGSNWVYSIASVTSLYLSVTMDAPVVSLPNVSHLYFLDASTKIPASFMDNLPNVQYVYIGDRVEDIAPRALAGSVSLSDIQVAPMNSYYTIYDNVLYSRRTTDVIRVMPTRSIAWAIPSTVTNIQPYSLFGCTDIDLHIPVSLVGISSGSFAGFTSSGNVTVQAGHPFLKVFDSDYLFDIRNALWVR